MSSTPLATPSVPKSPLPRMVWLELRIGLRTAVFRVVCLLLVALGWSTGGVEGYGVGMSAYATGETACLYLGVVVALWMALGAVRDSGLKTGTLIFTKPQPPERIGLARFLGLYGQVLLFLLALFFGAILGRWFVAHNLNGFPAYSIQYLRASGVLLFAACTSYSLALLTESPVGGAIIALYWIVVSAGREFLAKAFFPWYSQNTSAYLFLGLGVLGGALWFSRRQMRGERSVALWLRLLVPVGWLLGGVLIWGSIQNGHDPMTIESPALNRMSGQNMVEYERAPGFILPDQHGKPTRLSQFPGRILIVALWSPRDPDSMLLLQRLNTLYQKYSARGVLPVTICLSEDYSAATTFATGEQLQFPNVYDWGTHNSPRQMEASPLAIAYRAEHLPFLVVTDRRHRVRKILNGINTYEGQELEEAVNLRLSEEPE